MSYRGPISYLHIAEKNSIAKEVAAILSEGTRRTGTTLSKFNPVFLFERDGQPHTFSSVRGHIFDYQLPPECKSWANFDNSKILTRAVPMIRKPGPDMEDLLKNIQKIAMGKRQLILWLDCDRQGEAIAFEVIEVVRKVNPNISIKRARFAAVTRTDIMRAWGGLVQPNQLQADAVNYRIQMDFRMGCAFTRYQTVTFNKQYRFKQNSVISYGPCQMPTLGFVVERYLQIKYFKPQKYWVIKATIILDQKTRVQLRWQRVSIRDQTQANVMFYSMFQLAHRGEGKIVGRILARNKNQKKRYRPYPLTTVAFQKLATDKLRLSSAQAMKIAQKLYQQGFISYPRTQTNAFPPTINMNNLIQRLRPCPNYQQYVQKLLQGRFMKPKVGNQNDQAHSPIHPVKPADPQSLTPNEWKVYDLISRHFLACCSRDAVGIESEIVADIGQERFKASHIAIKQKNYLEIYPFDKWVESEFPGEIPEQFEAAVELSENKTKPPGYLTESELIGLMEKNQIGTDATIHEHIQTIQNRKYAFKSGNTFKPTNLGASLIVTYKSLGLHLEDCNIRRLIEQRMDKIAEGQIERDRAAIDTLAEVIPVYQKLKQIEKTWLEQMGKGIKEYEDLSIMEISNDTTSYANRPNNHQQRQRDNTFTNTNSNSHQNRPNNHQQRQGENTFNNIICYFCKEPGHLTSQCPSKQRQNNINNQRINTNANTNNQRNKQPNKYHCFICGQQGHFAPACPNKNNRNNNDRNNNDRNNYGRNNNYNNINYSNNNNNSNNSNNNTNNNNNSNNNNKKVCPACGAQGRHPRGTSCPTVRKKKTNTNSDTQDDL